MKGEKMSLRLSVLGLSISLFATSTLSFFVSHVAAQASDSVEQPEVATVESMVGGDLMCYVTLVDENGIRHQDVGATFEMCENQETFLNKKVNLAYEEVQVNDCQSAEPCGKTRLQTLIIQMTLSDSDKSRTSLPCASVKILSSH
ncbi:MAG: hypothetical protein KME25_32870 [Symplocastrum torsivum CPER-KK1]|jgi:hypothetical protein|uniref:Uncharacterized protein n=1 Tax=Symplocastrum torsivum CPER-KK1 TaxID=450513 RepID=A0A951PTY5_9CYAN|nr:hypothetical protein [Symplocastrum torsivum CPER-KK1]